MHHEIDNTFERSKDQLEERNELHEHRHTGRTRLSHIRVKVNGSDLSRNPRLLNILHLHGLIVLLSSGATKSNIAEGSFNIVLGIFNRGPLNTGGTLQVCVG